MLIFCVEKDYWWLRGMLMADQITRSRASQRVSGGNGSHLRLETLFIFLKFSGKILFVILENSWRDCIMHPHHRSHMHL
jgi:hypothetical protein